MFTSEEITSTTSLTWREIPKARKQAIKALMRYLVDNIRLSNRIARTKESDEFIPCTIKNHPLMTWVRNENGRRIPVIPIKAYLEYASDFSIDRMRDLHRHLNIATSMARGKTLAQIEPPAKDGNHKSGYRAPDKELLDWAQSILEGSAKLYIFVRPELTPGQRAAQAVHAVSAFKLMYPFEPWMNGTIIIKTAPLPSRSYWDTFDKAFSGCKYSEGLLCSYTDSDITQIPGPHAFAFFGPSTGSASRFIAEFPLA